MVRHELYQALSTFEGSYLGEYLWIDALCINQTDTRERNHQVSMMDDIFRHASNTTRFSATR